MLGHRTALCVGVLFATGCFSEDRPLNDFVAGGAAGAANAGGNDSGADAGEATEAGGAPSAGRGGSDNAGTGGTAGTGQAGSGGSSAGGSTAGSSSGGASGGSSGDDGSAGQGATTSVPVGALCESSSGEGCDVTQFCRDAVVDACHPDSASGCAGFCAEPAPRPGLTTTCEGGDCLEGFSCVNDPVDPQRRFCTGTKACDASAPCPPGFVCGAEGNCAPELVDCSGPILCPAIAAACPAGFTHSVVDDCFGPCVPVESCACQTDGECGDQAASCDRVAGRCVIPKAPEPRCALPFEAGDCEAAIPVFAFVDGRCQPQTYGGCGGNDNRFYYLEECRNRCEGQPVPDACPEGHVLSRICLECGVVGGCAQEQTVCAQTCDENTECSSPFLQCYEGLCQAAPCI